MIEGYKTIPEIQDVIKSKNKHGTEYHAMVNIMSKSGLYEKKGITERANVVVGMGVYKIALWGLK